MQLYNLCVTSPFYVAGTKTEKFIKQLQTFTVQWPPFLSVHKYDHQKLNKICAMFTIFIIFQTQHLSVWWFGAKIFGLQAHNCWVFAKRTI